MKKIYAVGLALACGLGAMAAPQSASKSSSKVLNSSETIYVLTESNATVKAPAAAIASVDEFIGAKRLNCTDVSGTGNTLNTLCNVVKKNANTVVFNDFGFSNNNAEATVDVAAGTLTFKNQTPLGQVNTAEGYKATYLYTATYVIDPDASKPTLTGIKEAVGTIEENGDVKFDANVAFVIGTEVVNGRYSYFAVLGEMVIENVKFNTPTSLEGYQDLGTGKFTDGWFNPLFSFFDNFTVGAKDVTVMRNPEKPNEIVVVNPYGDAEFADNDVLPRSGNGNGYLIFNIEYPSCVYPVALVKSGYNVVFEEEDGSQLTREYYNCSSEGNLIFSGADPEQLIEDAEIVGEDLSNLTDNTITILECYNGAIDSDGSFNPVAYYWWTDGNGPDASGQYVWLEQTHATLELPEGWSGIKNVAVDSDASVRYYNLQGMEVSAPVKGQLTIKKQGNKAVKFIAK